MRGVVSKEGFGGEVACSEFGPCILVQGFLCISFLNSFSETLLVLKEDVVGFVPVFGHSGWRG
jgi:hypothetical protein